MNAFDSDAISNFVTVVVGTSSSKLASRGLAEDNAVARGYEHGAEQHAKKDDHRSI